MPKGPKGQRPPSIDSSIELFLAKPPRQRLNASEKRARKAAAVQLFVKEYARPAHPNFDPNDRSYDREVEKMIRHMKATDLYELLRDGEDD
jgi:hypothetical protein